MNNALVTPAWPPPRPLPLRIPGDRVGPLLRYPPRRIAGIRTLARPAVPIPVPGLGTPFAVPIPVPGLGTPLATQGVPGGPEVVDRWLQCAAAAGIAAVANGVGWGCRRG